MNDKDRLNHIVWRVFIYQKAYEDLSEVMDGWVEGVNTDNELLTAYNKFKHDISEKEDI